MAAWNNTYEEMYAVVDDYIIVERRGITTCVVTDNKTDNIYSVSYSESGIPIDNIIAEIRQNKKFVCYQANDNHYYVRNTETKEDYKIRSKQVAKDVADVLNDQAETLMDQAAIIKEYNDICNAYRDYYGMSIRNANWL